MKSIFNRILIISCLIFSYFVHGFAQELNIDVKINTPALKLADPKVFQSLETAINEFLNNTVWTEDEFDKVERIEGSFQINVKEELSTNSFVGDFYISTSRPIFNSNYYTSLINYVDRDVQFSYEEFSPLYNNSVAFSDNLSAILTYYVNIILGFDYDSYAPYGGERFFQIAQNIVSSVPPNVSSRDRAWVSIGSTRNRYWLVENVLNGRVREYRSAFYDYHRRALDIMADDAEKGRAILMSSLKSIDNVNNVFPNSMILKMFSDSKRKEILEVFKKASRPDQRLVFNIMTAIDPAQSSDFAEFK